MLNESPLLDLKALNNFEFIHSGEIDGTFIEPSNTKSLQGRIAFSEKKHQDVLQYPDNRWILPGVIKYQRRLCCEYGAALKMPFSTLPSLDRPKAKTLASSLAKDLIATGLSVFFQDWMDSSVRELKSISRVGSSFEPLARQSSCPSLRAGVISKDTVAIADEAHTYCLFHRKRQSSANTRSPSQTRTTLTRYSIANASHQQTHGRRRRRGRHLPAIPSQTPVISKHTVAVADEAHTYPLFHPKRQSSANTRSPSQTRTTLTRYSIANASHQQRHGRRRRRGPHLPPIPSQTPVISKHTVAVADEDDTYPLFHRKRQSSAKTRSPSQTRTTLSRYSIANASHQQRQDRRRRLGPYLLPIPSQTPVISKHTVAVADEDDT
ncbi:hypothetical protein CABS01_16542 [Colletotrichum abscissum]|uniref:uncharacterized protein n=1 Tax=Colletotrichum abscissum TaxID=1671311 RepID=UPI0027D500EB|nr:uncharacterized protein CABS01_16542 [Colletotrichum abscissum]KAK1521566.1 hypothetical protein CABS01_16542 [Colletotrichum abscissum]